MGLRVTLNQMTWFAVPIVMGVVAEIFGRELSFYVVGLTATVMIVVLGLWASWRNIFM